MMADEVKSPGVTPGSVPGTLPPLPVRDGAMTLARLIDLYAGRYKGRDTSRMQRLAWWRAKLGHVPLSELTDDHVHRAQQELAAEPARCYKGKTVDGGPIFKAAGRRSGATINRYIVGLAAVCTWAIRQRVAPRGWVHPCVGIEKQPESGGKARWLTVEEVAALLAAVDANEQAAREKRNRPVWPRLRLLILMALKTGARKSSLLALRWRDIDWKNATAEVARTKNGDPILLNLTPDILQEARRFKGLPNALLFPSPIRPEQPYAFEQLYKDCLRRAGIKGATFHTLRHTFASYLGQAGKTALEIAELTGHRSLSMVKHYVHLGNAHRARMVNEVFAGIAA